MLVRITLVAVALLLPLAPARSQGPPGDSDPLVSGQIGALVLSLPAYPGARERWVVPVPFVDLRVARRFYVGDGLGGLSAGAGAYLVQWGDFSWTADLALTSDRPEDRADALAGMGDRGFGVFAGSSLAYRIGPLEASAAVAVGLEDRMGSLGVLGLSAGGRLGGRWFGQGGGAVVFGDCANLRWDFGVSDAQAARRRELLENGAPDLRPEDGVPFTPRCGLREARTTAALGYALSPRLSLFGSATGVRLERGAAASPLTRERTSWEAGLGLSWRL
jgi:outer membrane scaffolding protein for murein synthesis (MipA/OmpV family)